jgi:hypothetical protein
MFSVTYTGVARVRLRGDPVRIPFKNFLAIHQLDVDLWTEFLCMDRCQDWPIRRVYQ